MTPWLTVIVVFCSTILYKNNFSRGRIQMYSHALSQYFLTQSTRNNCYPAAQVTQQIFAEAYLPE